MSILQRTIKLVLATCLSVSLAWFLGLSSFTTAGTLALLSVLDTRRDSLLMAFNRFLSTLLALASSVLIFWLLGFNILTLGLYLALYVPLAYRFKLASSIAPATVLVFHIWLENDISLGFLGNELALLLVGSGVALLLNSYMTSKEKELIKTFNHNVDLNKQLFRQLSDIMRTGQGYETITQTLEEMDVNLDKGLQLAQVEVHNQIVQQKYYYYDFFVMKNRQQRLIHDMVHVTKQILDLEDSTDTEENRILSELFYKIYELVNQADTTKYIERSQSISVIDEIDQDIARYTELFKSRPLPTTWETFEIRSNLFIIFYALGTFSQLNLELYNQYREEARDIQEKRMAQE